MDSNCLCETNAVILHVKLSVKFTDEYVSQDPEGAVRSGDVHPHESRQAHSLAKLGHLKNYKKKYKKLPYGKKMAQNASTSWIEYRENSG